MCQGSGDLLFSVANAASRKAAHILVLDSAGCIMRRARVAVKPIVSFAVAQDYLAVATQDLSIIVLDAANLAQVAVFPSAHAFPITCLAFSRDEMRLMSGSADGTVLVHSVPEIKAGGRI